MRSLAPISFVITREMLVEYAHASGDQNPIHQNEEFAKAVGLPNVIAHGMLTMGLAASAVEQWIGRCDGIREFGTRFSKPVIVPAEGTTLTFEGIEVTHASGQRIIEVTATSGGVEVLSSCRAVIDERSN